MAGPIIPGVNPISIPEGYSSEQESVFDPLYETLIKKAMQVTGMDDPTTSWQSLINPIAGPAAGLISKIPFNQVASRNKMLLDIVSANNVSPALQQAVEFAAKKYPRTLAHVNYVNEIPKNESQLGMFGMTFPNNNGRSSIDVDPKQLRLFRGKRNLDRNIAETFGHELTHTAQNIWDKNSFARTGPYAAATQTFGYHPNLFEEGARKAGKNFKEKMLGPDEPGLIQKVLDMFNLSK